MLKISWKSLSILCELVAGAVVLIDCDPASMAAISLCTDDVAPAAAIQLYNL